MISLLTLFKEPFTTVLYDVHFPQNTSPQSLQWCFLFVSENFAPQVLPPQNFTSLLSCQRLSNGMYADEMLLFYLTFLVNKVEPFGESVELVRPYRCWNSSASYRAEVLSFKLLKLPF